MTQHVPVSADDPEMEGREPLAGVRLRAVPVAVVVTMLACAALALWATLPGHGEIEAIPFWTLLGCAVVGTLVMWRLPWPRLVDTALGSGLLYAWTVADALLISGALATTGGGNSVLFLLYALPIVFGAVLYPRPVLVWIVVTTAAAYGVVVVAGSHVPVATLVLRITFLGLLGIMGGFLSGILHDHLEAVTAARAVADRRSALLEAVTVGTRSMTRLEHDAVLVGVVEAVSALGLDASSLALFDEGGETYHVVHAKGLPDEYRTGQFQADDGITGLVRASGTSVVVEDYEHHPSALPVLRGAGFRAVIASPIFVGERMSAVLIGGTRGAATVGRDELDSMELLAAQAGAALLNVEQFEAQRRMVARLEELDRLKQDFVATVSHELRTPLTVIKGLGRTLTARWDRLDDDVRRELLERVNDNAESLGATIDTLLDFARLEAGRLDVRARTFDVGQLVVAVTTRLGTLFDGRELAVDVRGSLVVEADADLIERVCENLLSNAAKHTPDGCRIRVRAGAVDGRVRVAVQDDGHGIPPHEVARIGDRFFRGGDVHTRATRGTGLGLAFVCEVLELHGTTLDVDSEVDRGSTFAFELPLVAAALEVSDR